MKIEEAVEFLKQYTNSEVYTEKCVSAHLLALTALRSMPETTKPGWISIKERLPKDFDQALVYDGDKHYPIGICHKGESGIWHSDMAYGMGTITHWMPLPEPPEED